MLKYKWYRKEKNELYNSYFDYYYFFYYFYYKHLFGSLIKKGNKLLAFNFLIQVRSDIKKKVKISPHIVFLLSFSKITPLIILYPLKLGGIIYRVPRPISLRKQKILTIRWMIKNLKEKHKTKSLILDDFVSNILLSLTNKGVAIKKKKEEYLFSDANRHLIRRFKH